VTTLRHATEKKMMTRARAFPPNRPCCSGRLSVHVLSKFINGTLPIVVEVYTGGGPKRDFNMVSSVRTVNWLNSSECSHGQRHGFDYLNVVAIQQAGFLVGDFFY
jgi:hypothetical protein